MKQTAVDWLLSELNTWQAITDEDTNQVLDTVIKITQKAKVIESEQHTAIYKEGMANSEGMMNFLYTEVEGRVDALHNGRYKE